MKKLKIAIIMQSPDLGGAETFMLSLVNEFQKKGNEILVATNEGKYYELLKNQKIAIVQIPFKLDVMGNLKGLLKSIFFLPFAIWFYLRLIYSFKTKKIDLILMSGFSEKMLVSLLSLFFNIPVFWIEYGPLKEVFRRNLKLPKLLYLSLKKIPKKIIVPSSNTMKSLTEDAHVSRNKLELIPCGVRVNTTSAKVKENTFIIGSVSRLTREKGQQHLIDALPKVVKEIPEAELVLVGDGPDKAYFQKLAKKSGIDKKIQITGLVENPDEYYSKFDLFVFPTVWELEGFGLVVLEAMSYKLPVVVSDMGPSKEIVVEGNTGYITNVNRSTLLAKKIIMLGKNNKLRKSMGEAGYRRLIENYDIKYVSENYLKLFYENI